MMTAHELYDLWAPVKSCWSVWVKPVLFAYSPQIAAGGQWPAVVPDVQAVGPADGRTAVAIDLPTEQGVWAGLELARRGYRPVPLYNACPPGAADAWIERGLGMLAVAMVNVAPIVAALVLGGEELRQIRLPDDAPPAFLLDARRRIGTGISATPGTFDNRSLSLPTDFPSANLLLSKGIVRAILLQEAVGAPQEDLAHTLLRWQQAGIEIVAAGLGNRIVQAITIPRPRAFRSLFHRFAARMGFRRNVLGGFGGTLPEPSSG